jgi:hypothetical protein
MVKYNEESLDLLALLMAGVKVGGLVGGLGFECCLNTVFMLFSVAGIEFTPSPPLSATTSFLPPPLDQ